MSRLVLFLLVLLACCAAFALARGVSIVEDDPVWEFKVEYPRDGGVSALPLRFKFSIDAVSFDALKSQYGAMFVCVELDGVKTKCSPILQLRIIFQELPEGRHVAHAFIFDGVTRYHETNPISFSLPSAENFDAHIQQQREQIRADNKFPRDLGVLQWAEQQQSDKSYPYNTSEDSLRFANEAHSDELKLVIGIKTAVLTNFAQRQAIRETWARKSDLPSNAKVFSSDAFL